MDALSFYGLEPTDDRLRWRLPVVPGLTSRFGALFGGAALGAAVAVLEVVTERPLVWATVQYLEFARMPDIVELEVIEVVRGNTSSQARVLGRVRGEELFTVVAALGRRQLPWTGEWATLPNVSAPHDSPLRPLTPDHAGSISDHLEMRVARFVDPLPPDSRHAEWRNTPLSVPKRSGATGRTALWVRLPDGLPATAAALLATASQSAIVRQPRDDDKMTT